MRHEIFLCFSYAYWTDWGLNPYIARVGMDGTGMQKIITTKLGWPNALALDYTTQKMWWGDAHLDYIEWVQRCTCLLNLVHPRIKLNNEYKIDETIQINNINNWYSDIYHQWVFQYLSNKLDFVTLSIHDMYLHCLQIWNIEALFILPILNNLND